MRSKIVNQYEGLVAIDLDGDKYVLDLQRCDAMFTQQIFEAFEERDAERFIMSAGDNIKELGLVLDNFGALQERGMAEAALAIAFTATRTSNAGFQTATIERAFRSCDRDVLRDQGEVLPAMPVRVYRGVAGEGAYRRVRGLSWTTEIECACWFATRFNLPEPAVYTAIIHRADLFYITSERSEAEVVGRPRACRRYPLTAEKMHEAAARWAEQKQSRQDEYVARLVQSNR